MKVVGITGGIGSGKTTVSKLFETLGIPVYYADAQAKRMMTSNPKVKREVKALLGPLAYHQNGKPNRTYIAHKVFNDAEILNRLNQIVHPAVRMDAERWVETFKTNPETPYVLQEAALLVETGSYKGMNALIVVSCPEEIRIDRVMRRDKLNYESVLLKIKNQMKEEEKVKVADFVIINDGKSLLIPQVWAIHRKLTQKLK